MIYSCLRGVLFVGYKLRTHLSKSLQTRCKTIRKAVCEYNAAAASLNPPRPPLDWARVSNYGFLEEFDLLQDTNNDIRSRPWTKPAAREVLKLRRRIARAHEEITRCNVEVRRLHTAIRDEHSHFSKVLADQQAAADPRVGAITDFCIRRHRINLQLLLRVRQIYSLDGFSGVKQPGTRLNTSPSHSTEMPPHDLETMIAELATVSADSIGQNEAHSGVDIAKGSEEEALIEDDETDGDIGGMIQYIANLAL